MMANICLIVAMRAEIPQFLRDKCDIYQVGGNVLKVAVSGIGPRKARRTTQQVCSGFLGFYPDWLINLGFCGAVRNDLNIGHIVIADRLSHRGQELRVENQAVEKAVNLLADTNYHLGKIQTFKWPVITRAKVSGDAIAVDMESFAIAQTAAKYQTPALIIKAVSDIVPEHADLCRLMTLVRRIKINMKKARGRLSMIVKKGIEDQDLIK